MKGWRFRQRKQRDADLNDEIAFDLAAEADKRKRLGASTAEAERASHRDFGNVALLKEDVRETWGWTWLERLVQDLRYGWRTLRGSPLFTTTAVLSLALGIGANTAIYSVMDAILFRALPVENPRQLVIPNWRAAKPPTSEFTQPVGIRIVDGNVYTGPNDERISPNFPWPFYELLRDHNDVFSTVFAYKDGRQLNLLIQGNAELGRVEFVSGNFFRSLGVPTAAGRLIDDSDDRPDAPPVAVLSYEYWRNRFAEDPAVIGQTIRISNVPVTIAGVAAPEFFGVDPAAVPMLYVPIVNRPRLNTTIRPDERSTMFTDPHYYWTDMMGRLRPGITIAQADAEVSARFQQFVTEAGTNAERRAFPALHLLEGGSGINSLRRKYSKPLLVLMTMVALILVIACANIANLLLARAAVRRREIALRLSIGASRFRVVRQLLTESVMLAMMGGIAGLGVAAVGIRFLLWLLAGGSGDFYLHTGIDLRVLAFTVAVTLVAGLLFGFAPALEATRVDLAPALKAARIGATRGRARRIGLSQILVVAQIALSLVLVLGALLFVLTMTSLRAVELGFNAENILTFNLNASNAGYEGAALTAFYARMEERLSQLAGVSAATVTNAPLAERAFRTPFVFAEDRKGGGGWNSVGPTFFETMQIPILRGRGIDSRDVEGGPNAVVVNEAFAKTYFPNQDPLGQQVGIIDGTNVTIIGVAKNSRESLREEIIPFAYIPYRQNLVMAAWRGMTFEIRTAGNALALAEAVREALRQEAPNVPMADIKTQSQRFDDSIVQERTFASLCTAFAVLALIIACVGLYGSMAYSVAQRTNEIGVRMALSAKRLKIVQMVLREVLILALAGLAIGFFGAWNSMRAVESFLFGVTPADPSSILLATAILAAALLFAAYVPAMRASRIEPIVALRHE
ncbi:MAG: ABC transporter permease [Acidobacteria bacterium]|nr:ABC transporter permease [Acidobacteriota bacterium]MDA1236686.1 ABC transporter permease [Acidobacteriota bacterium]